MSPSNSELDDLLSTPPREVADTLQQCPGDIAVLGAGGKMGFHLCQMLQRAASNENASRRIVAVSRFADPAQRQRFSDAGLETIAADLADQQDVDKLPAVANLFFLAGVKFGTSSDPALLQRINVDAARLVASHFRQSRIVALSSGCVYSFTTPESGGSTEESATDPPGDYARSCLGREAAFVDASAEFGTPSALIRLNYANEPRYGVLVDIAQQILRGEPVDLNMGHVNVIWQRDAIEQIIRCLPHASCPPFVINITGPEVLSVREIALGLGKLLGKDVSFSGTAASSAWLSNAAKSHRLLGPPRTPLQEMMTSIANWLRSDGATLGKPTHFQSRDGEY